MLRVVLKVRNAWETPDQKYPDRSLTLWKMKGVDARRQPGNASHGRRTV